MNAIFVYLRVRSRQIVLMVAFERAKDETAFVNSEGHYSHRPITSREVKRHRPLMPRKIVGELVVIDVQERTATAIITRVAGEVHTGDWVEIQ